jgi:hypothetical protein
VAERIRLHLCSPASVGVADPVDFILMFWMLHEVRDQDRLFHELLGILKPEGRILVVEPRLHVTAERFERSLIAAGSAGCAVADRPRVALSRAAVLTIR